MKEWETVGELMARLNADPEFVAKRAAKERELEARVAEWQRAEAPMLEELRTLGVDVETVWTLVNTGESYSSVLPTLLKHLQRPYPDRVREGIARALAVPESMFAWSVLVRLYRDETDRFVKDGLAAALAAIADDRVIDDLIGLARDVSNGSSRILLLSALERSEQARARAALMELGTDPDLVKEIQVILKRLKRRKTKRVR